MTEKDPVLSTEHSRWWSSKRSPGGSATSQDAQVEVTLRTGVLVPEVEGSVHPSTGRRAAGDPRAQGLPAASCLVLVSTPRGDALGPPELCQQPQGICGWGLRVTFTF